MQRADELVEGVKKYVGRSNVEETISPEKAILPNGNGTLFGVEHARRLLEDGITRLRQKESAIMLIHGRSGTGKTALLNELYNRQNKGPGYFIRGKCFSKQAPYKPLLVAFGSFFRNIFTDHVSDVQVWKEKMEKSLLHYGDILNRLIPEIKWFIGPQPVVSGLTSEGGKVRTRQAIIALIHLFTEEKPLFILMEDLQWIDQETIDLLLYVYKNEAKNFKVIGSYRDDEILSDHPLTRFLTDLPIQKRNRIIIPLVDLKFDHINDWIEHEYNMSVENKYYLTKHIFRFTQGNPLFVSQLLQLYIDENIIYFNKRTGNWEIKHDIRTQLPLNDSLIDVIVWRFEKLTNHEKTLMKIAACFGKQFSTEELASIIEQAQIDVTKTLENVRRKGLIIETTMHDDLSPHHNDVYRFSHDKIQLAIYETIQQREKEQHHLRIGKRLAEYAQNGDPSPYLFKLVEHLNRCPHLLSKEEKNRLARWNNRAGDKAKEAASFSAAFVYYESGLQLIPKNKRDVNDPLIFNLIRGLGETAYLNQRFKRAEELFDDLLASVHSRVQRNDIYTIKMLMYTHQQDTEKAIQAGLEALEMFGLHLRRDPTKTYVAKEYALTKIALRRGQSNKRNKKMPDADYDGMMNTLMETVIPSYLIDQQLAAVLICKAMRLMLTYGRSENAPIVFMNYALILSAGFQDYKNSYKYGRLAVTLAEESGDLRWQAIVDFTYACFVHHWKHPIRENIAYFKRSQQMSMETGNLHNASANCAFIGATLLLMGETLRTAQATIRQQIAFAEQHEYPLAYRYLREMNVWMDRMRQPTKQISWNHASFVDDPAAKIMHYTLRLQMSYLFRNEQEAIRLLAVLDPLMSDTFHLMVTPELYYYDSLWTAFLLKKNSINRKDAHRKMKRNIKKLKQYATHAPGNYKHMYVLVKAEWMHVTNRPKEAIFLYQEAINEAKKGGFLQDAAIANECAGTFCMKNNFAQPAMAYLHDAYVCYKEWGADYLADQLLQKYPDQMQIEQQSRQEAVEIEPEVDVHALFETSTALASEISPQQLLMKLLRIMRMDSGAERVFLILKENGLYQVAAAGLSDGNTEVYPAEHHDYSISIVQYVAEHLEMVLLVDAEKEGDFKENADIIRRKVKSVLCLPMVHQGKLLAILYMENNQMPDTFKEEQVLLVTLLSSQAAVALENTRCYDQLEEKIQERTFLLHETNDKLTKINQTLAETKEKRRDLLSKVTHDIRSPLVAVRGYLDLILGEIVTDSKQQWGYLQAMKTRLSSMEKLLKDLMEIAQLELESIDFTMDFIPSDQLFHYLKSRLDVAGPPSQSSYTWVIPEQKEFTYPLVQVDVDRIEQVMMNLLTNAEAHAKQKEIRVALSFDNKEEVVFSVADQGEGIPPSEIPYIFDRYYTSRTEGHGLGLVICQEIIKKHDGQIWITSEQGIGTTVHVALPIVKL